MIRFILQHPIAFLAALLLHIGIVGLFVWQTETEKPLVMSSNQPDKLLAKTVEPEKQPNKEQPEHDPVPALAEPMRTFTVDKSLVQQQIARIKQQEAEKLAKQQALLKQAEKEKKRLAELKKQQQLEKRKAELARKRALEEQRKLALAEKKAQQEKKRAEVERRKVQEAKRLAELEKRKAEEAKRKAALAAKEREKAQKEAQRLLAEAQKKRQLEEAKKKALEAEIKRKAEEKKKLEQAAILAKLQQEQAAEEAALLRQMEEEAAKRRAAQRKKQLQSLRQVYISSITAKVKENWRTPAKISDKAQCELLITQTPQGNVSSVKVENCNRYASQQFKKAAESAVYRAQPLPQPPEKELFERNIRFVFKP